MTWEILFVLLLALLAIVVFAKEWLPVDTTALVILTTLIASGVVNPEEGISGFSNEATITILALFILGAGLQNSGAITYFAKRIQKYFLASEWKVLGLIMLFTATVSAFINNTAVVIVFLPIMLRISKITKISLNRLLMPMSFAAMAGGATTIIGTSTNLVISSISEESGYGRFNIFEFSLIGAILVLGLVAFFLIIGRKLIPERDKEENLTEEYNVKEFLTDLVITKGSNLVGKKLKDTELYKDPDIEILEIAREDGSIWMPKSVEKLKENDSLLLKGGVEEIVNFTSGKGTRVLPEIAFQDEDLETNKMTLVEVLITPNSKLADRKIKKIGFHENYNSILLAVHKKGDYFSRKISYLKANIGDILLLETPKNNIRFLRNTNDFIILEQHVKNVFDMKKVIISFLIVLLVVALAAFSILPILTSALIGSVLMLLTGCVSLQKAYQFIDWKIIFLLAGLIPLGIAIQKSGAGDLLASNFVYYTDGLSPRTMISLLFLLTVLLTSIISNNATAILIAPIAIAIAEGLSLDPKPFLITVMFAASTSFITPIGYQTNTLIYSIGNYKFNDFLKIGGLVTLLFWVLATWLIPIFYM